jgi:hypothetical protein
LLVGAADPSNTPHTEAQQAENWPALVHAASAALPIGELDAQAFGGRSAWNTQTRPGRIAAWTRSTHVVARAGQLALESSHDLNVSHVVAAIRSLVLWPADLLVDALTGQWLSTPAAVRHRGLEISRAIIERAHIVADVERNARP